MNTSCPIRGTIDDTGAVRGGVVVAAGALLGLVAAALPATWASRASLGSLIAASAVRGAGGSIRSATTALPLTAFAQQATLTFPGAPGNTGDPTRDAALVDVVSARAGYAEVMGVRLLSGRSFEEGRANVREALIDRHLAAQFFPGGNAIGATFPYRGGSATIVGVIEQPRLYELHRDGRPQVIMQAEGSGAYTPFFVLRVSCW